MTVRVLRYLAVSALALSACSDRVEWRARPADAALSADEVPDGCHPYLLAGQKEGGRGTCVLPYPSDFYRVPDGATRTGFRVELRGAAKPLNTKREDANPLGLYPVDDGFSLVPTIVATLKGALSPNGLSSIVDDGAPSARKESATVLLEADTGQFVAHYTDIGLQANDDDLKPIMLRPHVTLKPKTRYVVALRNVLVESGEKAPVPPAFALLRDGKAPAGKDPAIKAYADRFAGDILGPLEKAGIPRSELQLAWDFTTGSSEAPIADMLRVREMTLAWLTTNKPVVTVTKEEPASGNTWKFVHGTVTVPLFLESPTTGAKMSRDAGGGVQMNGTAAIPFLVQIPASVHDQAEPGRALAYGHGFFGSRVEVSGGLTRTIGSTLRAVMFAIDWWGLAEEDRATVANSITGDTKSLARFTDRSVQSFANWLVMTQAIKTTLTELPALKREGGQLLYEPKDVYLLGCSGGHLMGAVLGALDPNLSRIVLNVGGVAYTHMMQRAAPFGPLAVLLNLSLNDKLLEAAFTAMVARSIERIDGALYAPFYLKDKLPGSPADRRVLMQTGLGDPSVPNGASFLHARALGISQMAPADNPIYGLPAVTGTTDQSALQLFDYGIDTDVYRIPQPPPLNEVHDGVRVHPAALRQMDAFLHPDGKIIDACNGTCKKGQP